MLRRIAVANPEKYLFEMPSGSKIADVVASIIRAVKADRPEVTNKSLAYLIDAHDADVISRLENAETKKVPASLIVAIGGQYGDKYIQPYLDLMGLKAVKSHHEDAINALPALTALAAKIAANIRDGGGLDHQGLAAILPELREADGVISTLRARASEMGMSA
jgi:hypothetical protein